MGLEAVATLGGGRRWFFGAGYRFRGLPSMDLQRSPPAGSSLNQGPGGAFTVTHDEVRLSQDTHLATLRLGRAFRGDRLAPYLGLQGRWTDLEIDDELDLRSPLGDQTALRTRARFDGDSVLTVAGLDAKLGGPVRGRTEVTFGDGDVAVLLKMVYLWKPKTLPLARPPQPLPSTPAPPEPALPGPPQPLPSTPAPPEPAPPGPLQTLPSTPAPGEPAPDAPALAADLLRFEADFRRELEPIRAFEARGDSAAYRELSRRLLDRIEEQVVARVGVGGFTALADWVRDRFAEARAALAETARSVALPWPPGHNNLAALAAGHGPRSLLAEARTPESGGGAASWSDLVLRALRLLFVRARANCLTVRVRFVLEPAEPTGASFVVYPRYDPGSTVRIPAGSDAKLRIGSYSYLIESAGGGPAAISFRCDAGVKPPGPGAVCPLDLVTRPVVQVDCRLDAGGGSCTYGLPDPRCPDDR